MIFPDILEFYHLFLEENPYLPKNILNKNLVFNQFIIAVAVWLL